MKKAFAFVMSLLLLLAAAVPAVCAADGAPYADSAFFTYKDYTLHYRVQEAKDPKGQIMFLHGFAETTHSWENLTAILTENGYRCVLVDLPDFGYSSRETKETDRLPREEIVHALMTELSGEPWYLAGHSMGGYVALALAQTWPESVKNLLLYSTAGNNGIFHLIDPLTHSHTVASGLGPIIEFLGQSRPFVQALLLVATAEQGFDYGSETEKVRTTFTRKGTGAGIVYYLSCQTDTDYAKVEQMPPLLFMNGDRDFVCPPLERIPLRQHMPKGSVDYTVKGGGHMFIETRAQETARVTLDFLAANP